MKPYLTIVLVGLATLLIGCPPERPEISNTSVEPDEVSAGGVEPVAVINGDVLTKAEFERRINSLSPVARSRFASSDARKQFLESQIQFEILADIAEERGYGRRPSVIHAMKETMVRQMLAEQIRSRLTPADITDEEIQRYYRENRYDFIRPEERRVAAVISDRETVSRQIYGQLENALSKLHGEARINPLRLAAERHGIDPQISQDGGDLGWISDPEHPANQNSGRNKVMAQTVFEFKAVGDFSEPIRIEDNWYIVMLIDRRPSNAKTLEEVENKLRDKLYELRRREIREELLKKYVDGARVEINESVVETIDKPDPAAHDTIPTFFELDAPVRDLKPRGEK